MSEIVPSGDRLLSGGTTPVDSMPEWLQKLVPFSPTTPFISFAQAILFRGAGLDVVWRDFAALAAIGVVLFTLALARVRRTVAEELRVLVEMEPIHRLLPVLNRCIVTPELESP